MSAPSHYLLLPRAIFLPLTALLSIANGGLSSYALKTYSDQKKLASSFGATLHNSDINAAGGITIAAGALAGTICGILFLVLMFRPGHGETNRSVLLKEVVVGTLCLFVLAAAIVSTIFTTTRSATLDTSSLDPATLVELLAALGSLQYSSSKPTLTYTILNWLAFVSFSISFFLVSRAARHVLVYGPAVGVPKGAQERMAEPYLRWMLGEKGESREDANPRMQTA